MTESRQVMVVQPNSTIEITFQLMLQDNTLVDETKEGETLKFTLGDGTLLPNLEEMLIGLEQGTTAKLTLSPERAFGLSDPDNIHTMARQEFSKEMVLKEGVIIGFNTPTGEEIPGTIREVNEQSVQVDFNHPLADKTIVFTATIQAILS
ncbi:MAG: FKBP-type peptidyl-prolyl cis-trans isomerase [Thiomicrorhabdus sp.]|nr:FKBP-type peptidyl-prolyl cis-trans isomerase [Thiomicrorhabdus sp.]